MKNKQILLHQLLPSPTHRITTAASSHRPTLTSYASHHYLSINLKNRHRDCQGETYEIKDLMTASSDKQLLKPSTVRGNNRLKAKPAIPRPEKKRILESFTSNKLEYLSVSPMTPIYNIFQDRYNQRERDRQFQSRYFMKPSKKHLSKAIQYTLSQILTYLSMDDLFKVRLERKDFEKFIRKQPPILQKSVDVDELLKMQKVNVDKELTTNRKIQLIQNVFADPHFDAKDREILFQVLVYQIQSAQKSSTKLEKISAIKGLQRFANSKETNLEQLNILLDYLHNNYSQLVKLN